MRSEGNEEKEGGRPKHAPQDSGDSGSDRGSGVQRQHVLVRVNSGLPYQYLIIPSCRSNPTDRGKGDPKRVFFLGDLNIIIHRCL